MENSVLVGSAERYPLDTRTFKVLRKASEFEIRARFEKQPDVIVCLIPEELIDIGGVSSLKLEAQSCGGISTELTRDTVVIEIGDTTINTDSDFVAPEKTVTAVAIADTFRVEPIILSVVKLIDTEKFHTLPLDESSRIPKTGSGIISDSGEGISHR